MNKYKNDDYVTTVKKPRRCKQSIIPGEKKGKYYNGSKSIPGEHPVKFKKASEIK